MPTYYQKESGPTSPEALSNKSAIDQIGKISSNPLARNLQGNPLQDFTSGGMSLEDITSKYGGQVAANPYDPTKGPQINYGQGPQNLTSAQTQALAGGQSIQQASQLVPQNVGANQAIAQQNQDIQSRYKAAAANMPKTSAPNSSAEGIQQAKSLVQPPPKPSIADNLVQTDPYFQSIQQMAQDYFSPQNQRQSLTQEYQNLLQASGLQGLDTELLNMKNIIEGTEDDIRNEVVKAGGFATDSQVQALTNARNKQLIKNYNNLLETRNSKSEYLDKMMSLSSQDRQEADKRFDEMMNISFKMADYRDKMETNARNSYQKIADVQGYDTLYQSALSSGDPTAISTIERSLGMFPGGLKAVAEVSAQDKQQAQLQAQQKANLEMQRVNLEAQRTQSSLATDVAQRANIYSQIKERNEQPINGVDPKVFAKVQAAPEYKTINAVLPALQAINAYKDAIAQYGTGEVISGTGKGLLESTYGNALAAWKTLAALGALSGADFGLAETAVPEPSLFTRKSVQNSKLKASIDNALNQVDLMTKRLGQNYPSAANLLNQQLEDIRKIANPGTLQQSEISEMDAILAQ